MTAIAEGPSKTFAAAGDKVELNGDGKLRTVTAYGDGILAFKPALEIPPFRGVMVANWKNATSAEIDNGGVDGFGAKVSVKDFKAGDLLGEGRRTLPELPADVKASVPDPNRLVISTSAS